MTRLATLDGDGRIPAAQAPTLANIGATATGEALIEAANAAAARTALGLGGAAVLAVGTTAGTVAAGDDSRITGAVQGSGLDAAVTALDANAASALRVQQDARHLSTFGTVADVKAASNVQHSHRRAVVTFITDDGSAQDIVKLRPLSITYGVPMVAGLITSLTYSAADYLDLQNNHGWEIASHTDTHPVLTGLTDAQIETECSTSKAKLIAQGFNVKGIVYPTGANNESVRRISKRHYECGVSVSHPAGTNTGVIPSFNIKRVGLGSWFDPAVSGLPATDTLAYYQARVDQAVSEGSWLVFMLHPGDPSFTATQLGYLESVIQYVQSLNIEILTLSEAFDIFGPALEAGDYSGGTTGLAVDKHGNYVNIPRDLTIVSKAGLSAASPPSSFPAGVVSATSFLSTDAAGFPTNVGTLLTYRLNTDEELSFQIWHDYFAERIFMRRWRSAGWLAWGEIVTTANIATHQSYNINTTVNAYTAAQLIGAYPINKVTLHHINGAGTSGYPGSGLCTTWRLGGNGWNRQEFRKYQTNEIWTRYVSDADGSWTPWVLVGTQAFTTALRPTDKAVGCSIFDTTLGKPIWLKTAPSTWVDATGATV